MSVQVSDKKFKVYTASAGSGKTFRLTVDYLKIALRYPEAKFKRVLAITFTVKATNEMKARILEACQAFSNLNNEPLTGRNKAIFEALKADVPWADEEIAKRATILYHKILHNYSDFGVSTIDSFSQRLIRSFAFELDIPMNFEVQIDQAETLDLLVERLMDRVGEVDQELTILVQNFFDEKLKEKDSLRLKDDLIQSAQLMLKEESQRAREKLAYLEFKDVIALQKEIDRRFFQARQAVIDCCTSVLNELQTSGLELTDLSGGSRSVGLIFKRSLLEPIQKNISATFQKCAAGEKSWFTAKSPHKGSIVENRLSKYAIQYLEAVPKLIIAQSVKNSFSQVALIAELYRLYKEYQKEEDILLISEFNQIISSEVKEQPAPFLYEKVGEQYQHLLIDEFQDTSVMQWHNLLPLVTETLSKQEYNESLVVGDSKQAIYRFRGGETKQLNLLPNILDASQDVHLQEMQAILERDFISENMPFNYRSKQIVVNFNNALYQFIAEQDAFLPYRDIYKTYYQKPFDQSGQGFVHLSFIEKPTQEENETLVDRFLASLLSQITDIENRGIELGRVAVLCRRNQDLKNVAVCLQENGYEIESQETLALNQKKYIHLFISLVKLFYQPDNQILQAEVVNGFVWYEILKQDVSFLNQEIGTKKMKSIEEISQWMNGYNSQLQLFKMNKTELLNLFEQYTSLLPSYLQQSAYLSFFKNELFAFVGKYGNNIDGFLEWWALNQHKLYVKSAENKQAIKLVTIHKSKGLEFDIVLMPFANWRIRPTTESNWLEVKEMNDTMLNEYYISLNATTAKTSLADQVQANEESQYLDSLNLLYVATTRAVNELYIFTEKHKEIKHLDRPNQISMVFNAFVNESSAVVKTYGTPCNIEAHEKKSNSIKLLLNQAEVSFGQVSVAVKNKASVIWSEAVREKIDFGEVVHALLEKIETEQDVQLVVMNAVNEGLISHEDAHQIKGMLRNVVTHEELASFFVKNEYIFSEKSILTPNGEEFIPDRILIIKNKAKLIDFKTGEPQAKHNAQINRYADLLKQMGYDVIMKKLVYVDPLKIVDC